MTYPKGHNSILDEPVIAEFDTETGTQTGELEAGDTDTGIHDLTSEYWYFYYVKEGEDMYYLLTLAAKDFTQEEAEKIAGTAVITE